MNSHKAESRGLPLLFTWRCPESTERLRPRISSLRALTCASPWHSFVLQTPHLWPDHLNLPLGQQELRSLAIVEAVIMAYNGYNGLHDDVMDGVETSGPKVTVREVSQTTADLCLVSIWLPTGRTRSMRFCPTIMLPCSSKLLAPCHARRNPYHVYRSRWHFHQLICSARRIPCT